jgi:hypothetical protein
MRLIENKITYDVISYKSAKSISKSRTSTKSIYIQPYAHKIGKEEVLLLNTKNLFELFQYGSPEALMKTIRKARFRDNLGDSFLGGTSENSLPYFTSISKSEVIGTVAPSGEYVSYDGFRVLCLITDTAYMFSNTIPEEQKKEYGKYLQAVKVNLSGFIEKLKEIQFEKLS